MGQNFNKTIKKVARSHKWCIITSLVICNAISSVFAETTSVFVVKEYAYDYASNPSALEVASSLCGTRCNSVSGSINSYMMPGGWRLVRSPEVKKIILDIETPFISGKCICVGDEYIVTQDIPLPAINK